MTVVTALLRDVLFVIQVETIRQRLLVPTTHSACVPDRKPTKPVPCRTLLHRVGRPHKAAKLTIQEVLEIRSEFARHGKPHPRGLLSRIARRYALSRSTVEDIRDRVTWVDL